MADNFSGYNRDDLLRRAVFADDDIIAFDNVGDIRLYNNVKISNYIIALCNRGNGSLTINGEKFRAAVGDLIICRPNHIIGNFRESDDFECSCLCVSPAFMQNVMLMANNWNFTVVLEENPVIHLDADEAIVINAYSTLLKNTIENTSRRHHKEVLEALLRAAACFLTDVFFQHIDAATPAFCKSEVSFCEFLDLLTATYPRQRKVDYYAQKLSVTNRYLAAVCMKTSGKTALQLVTEYCIRDIKRELLKPGNTIKQVAVNLGFDNVSSLGRYFRNATGMSPRKFRAGAM